MRISGNRADIFAADHDMILEGLRKKDRELLHAAIHQHCDRWIGRLMKLPETLGFDPENENAVIEESFSEMIVPFGKR